MTAPHFTHVRAIYSEFGPYLRPYAGRMALGYAGLVASVAMTLLEPWPLKLIFDHILLDKPLPPQAAWLGSWFGGDKAALLAALSAALVVITALGALFSYINRYTVAAVGQAVTNDIRLALFDHLHSLSLTSLSGGRTGDLVLRLTSDIRSARDFLVGHIQYIANHGLTFIGVMAVMLWMNWGLTLLALAVVPPLYLLSFYFSSNVKEAVRSKRSKETQVASIVQENMSSIGVVQAFAQEDAEQRRFRQESRQGLEAGLRGARYGKAFREVVKVLTAAGTALVVWYGARLALGGQVTPGDLIVFASYARNLYTPIGSLSELIVDFMESLVAGERLLEIARIQSQIRDAPHAAPAPAFRGEVEFRGIVAGYQEGQPVLRNLSFRAAPGQTVALIGSSGAGKSTVVNLLLRFIDPWQGAILIDGHDIRRFRLRSLRSRISVVPQDPVLFQRSIRENIAYGKPEARFTEIVRAAQAAQAHEFIGSLPAGYDTVLGERGERISGGQRQRIALARAILLDAPILVLDEPSSALDAITEAQLRQTLQGHLKGKTVFVIAHRLSTMQDAGLILVLEEGQAVEQGSHEELLVRSPLYQRYHHAQSGALRK